MWNLWCGNRTCTKQVQKIKFKEYKFHNSDLSQGCSSQWVHRDKKYGHCIGVGIMVVDNALICWWNVFYFDVRFVTDLVVRQLVLPTSFLSASSNNYHHYNTYAVGHFKWYVEFSKIRLDVDLKNVRTLTTQSLNICGLYKMQFLAFENFLNYLKEFEFVSANFRP